MTKVDDIFRADCFQNLAGGIEERAVASVTAWFNPFAFHYPPDDVQLGRIRGRQRM